MKTGKRIFVVAIFLMALGGLDLIWPILGQARTVIVRLYLGDKFIDKDEPTLGLKKDLAFTGRTASIRLDRDRMADLSFSKNSASIIADEEKYGYDKKWLATPEQTKLNLYLPGNVPSAICYCGGHVLLMQGLLLKSGPPPPLAVSADAFFPVLERYGTKRNSDGAAEAGDVVAYYVNDGDPKPSHVATVIGKGTPPTVISKDQEERVYITGADNVSYRTTFTRRMGGNILDKTSPRKYRRYEIWGNVPWSKFRVQVVAGPIKFTDASVVTRISEERTQKVHYVGDTVEVRAEFNVLNPPGEATGLEMTADASLAYGLHEPASRDQRKHPSASRDGQGDTAILKGVETFQAVVTKPGLYTWLLSLSAKQQPVSDEAEAEYETQHKTVTFFVRERPEIRDFKLDVDQKSLPEGGKGKYTLGFKIKGVPGPRDKPLRAICELELTQAARDSSGALQEPTSVKLRSIEKSLTSLTGGDYSAQIKRDVKAGGAGMYTLRATLKVELPEREPIVDTKECTFEVVKR